MKSRKSVPKSKLKSQTTHKLSETSKISSRTNDETDKVTKVKPKPSLAAPPTPAPATVTKKLTVEDNSATSDVERELPTMTNSVEQTYPSFMSVISECSSCDQRQQTKAVNLKSVEEDCENVLQQFMNAFAQIAQSPRKSDDARQIAVQCLDYVNVILFNIDWLERERNQAEDQRAELDKNLLLKRRENTQLQDEIRSTMQINTDLKLDNREMLDQLYTERELLNATQQLNDSLKAAVEDQKAAVKAELMKLTESSMQVENAVVEKEIRWDNLNYQLQKRVAKLHRDHDQLKANYNLMCTALRVGDSGDVDNKLMDIGVLEADHEAEMVMMKYAHESFISELNKLNCKLWNDKFYKRSCLDEEMQKGELYGSWLVELKKNNIKYRDEISTLNKQVEDLLGVICSKLENNCRGDSDSTKITTAAF